MTTSQTLESVTTAVSAGTRDALQRMVVERGCPGTIDFATVGGQRLTPQSETVAEAEARRAQLSPRHRPCSTRTTVIG